MAGRCRIFEGVRRSAQKSTLSPSSSSSRLDLRWKRANSFYSSSLSYGREVPHCFKRKCSYAALQPPVSNSQGHTVFTLPGASKSSVIDAVRNNVRNVLSHDFLTGEGRAAVILATPRHASWLTDAEFMSRLVSALRPPGKNRGPAATPNIHVLTAVVDGLCPHRGSREMQHGFSIQLGMLASMLPDLWDDTTNATPSGRSDPEPSYLTVILRNKGNISATVPLANTLFETGRPSTLLASEWGVRSLGRPFGAIYEQLRISEKRTQKIDLSGISRTQKIFTYSPLMPITHPRMIFECLGNILAKVSIEGEPSPASKELQANIPRWLEARRSQSSDSEHAPGPVGVWALIIPGHLLGTADNALEASPETIKKALLNFQDQAGWARLGSAARKLAFEMSLEAERVAWELSPLLPALLTRGGHFHRILSGGGEWGAKASLLSLDPESSYGQDSEAAKLKRFQNSFFHGDDSADGTIARPGDFVQFFVERDPGNKPASAEQAIRRSEDLRRTYPLMAVGVGDLSTEDTFAGNAGSISAQRMSIKVVLNHFGIFSAEGVYLKSSGTLETKLDVPGTKVSLE